MTAFGAFAQSGVGNVYEPVIIVTKRLTDFSLKDTLTVHSMQNW